MNDGSSHLGLVTVAHGISLGRSRLLSQPRAAKYPFTYVVAYRYSKLFPLRHCRMQLHRQNLC